MWWAFVAFRIERVCSVSTCPSRGNQVDGLPRASSFITFSLTVRYELRVLVGFSRAHRGWSKVYTALAGVGILVRFSKELQWFWSHRRYPCSFEQGITMVSLPPKVSWCDLARNYNGLSAIASVHVRLSKELQWFGCRQKRPGAFEQGITMV